MDGKTFNENLKANCMAAVESGMSIAEIIGHLHMAILSVDQVARLQRVRQQTPNIIPGTILPPNPPGHN